MYRLRSLQTVSRELARYKIDLVGAEQVKRDKGGTVRACDIFFMKRKRKLSVGNRIASAVNTAEFVSDRMSYIVERSPV